MIRTLEIAKIVKRDRKENLYARNVIICAFNVKIIRTKKIYIHVE